MALEAAADTTWKGYSLAERDRRWNAVRKMNMFQALIAIGSTTAQMLFRIPRSITSR